MADFEYHVFRDYNVIFDEKGSKYGTIRLAQWVKEGKEPDESKAKIEIRHMINSAEGEQYGKGYAFDTEEGPHELVGALIDCGFGSTKDILKKIAKRDDFKDAVENINTDDDLGAGEEMFDIRDLMLFADESKDDNEEDNDVA